MPSVDASSTDGGSGRGKDGLLNQREAAELVGVSEPRFRYWWPSRVIHPPRIERWGKLLGYDREQLLEWAAERRVGRVSQGVGCGTA